MTGNAESQSLVVVGGWGVDAAMLREVVAEWPGRVHFVSLGDSLLVSNRTVSEVAQTLIRQYPEPAVWLGWSQGAQVVMAAAGVSGTSVKKVVTLAGFPRFVAGDGWSPGMALETLESFRTGLAADPNRAWRRFQQLLIHGCPQNEAGQARRELSQWIASGPVSTGEKLERGLDWLAQEDQRSLWRHLKLPTLHLMAGADALVRPWIPDLSVSESTTVQVVADMTHWPMGSRARECGRALNEFALAGEAV
jgi:pimeloyl-[acyl-carrier protein] methyl ester esterase